MQDNSYWDKIEVKYGGLFNSIVSKIYSPEVLMLTKKELLQEIRLKALKVIRKYQEDNKLEPDLFVETVEFGKYFKTALWNWRATLCKNIIKIKQEKFSPEFVYLDVTSIDMNDSGDKQMTIRIDNLLEDMDSVKAKELFEILDFSSTLTELQSKIINIILEDKYCYVGNTVSMSYLANKLNTSPHLISKEMGYLKSIINRSFVHG